MITNLQNLKPGTNFLVHEMPELSGVLVDINECSAKVGLGRHAVEVKIGDREFTAHKSRVEIWSPATVVETIDASEATSPPEVTQPDAAPEASPEENDMATATKKRKIKSTPKKDGVRTRRTAKGTKAAESKPVHHPNWKAEGLPSPVPPKKDRPKKESLPNAPKEVKDAVDKLIDSLPDPPSARKEHPKPKAKAGMSLLDAAAEVMGSDGKAWSCAEIVEAVLAKGIWKTSGKTPAQTLYSALIRDIDGKGKDSRFCRGDQKGEFKVAAK